MTMETKGHRGLWVQRRDARLAEALLVEGAEQLPIGQSAARRLYAAITSILPQVRRVKPIEEKRTPDAFSYTTDYQYQRVVIQNLSLDQVNRLNIFIDGVFDQGTAFGPFELDVEKTRREQPYINKRGRESLKAFRKRHLGPKMNGGAFPHIYLYFRLKDEPNVRLELFYTVRESGSSQGFEVICEPHLYSLDKRPEMLPNFRECVHSAMLQHM